LRDELERRKIARYKLCLPLVFKWTDESGKFMQEAAFTRDISTGGLFVSCVNCPPIGATLSLEIMLPPNSEIRSHGLRLDATVHVVRIASAVEEKGFAGMGDLATQKANAGSTLDSRMHGLSREDPRVH
jgi:PilZ domain-containing protein